MEFEDILAGKVRPDEDMDLTTLAEIEEELRRKRAYYITAMIDDNRLEMNFAEDQIKMLMVERESMRAKQAECRPPAARILLTDSMPVSPPCLTLNPAAQPPSSPAVNEFRRPNSSCAVVSTASTSIAPVASSAPEPLGQDYAPLTVTTIARQPAQNSSEVTAEVMADMLSTPGPAYSRGGQEPELAVTPSTRKKPGRPRRWDAPLREGKGQTFSVVMPPAMVTRIDELAASGYWRSRSDVIVYAMREYLKHDFDAAHPAPLPEPPKRRVGRPSMTKAQKQAAAAARKAAKATSTNTQGGQDGAATQ